MLFALLLQATSVVLLRHRLGKTWLRRPAVILVLTSVVYQGVSPVLMAIPSIGAWDIYRRGVQQAYVDDAALLLSAAMLVFTVAYLLTRPERAGGPEAHIPAAIRVPDWRLLALCCAPLAYLTYEGRGYNGTVGVTPGAPLPSELAKSFFVLLVALAAFGLVLAKGRSWFLPVLAAQSLLLAAAGERTPVITDAIVLVVLLCHAGMRPQRRQAAVALGLTVIAVLAVTGVRAHQGRSLYSQGNGLAARVGTLAGTAGTAGTQPPQAGPGLLAGMASRLDAVDFTAGILQARSWGQPLLSPAFVPDSFLPAVPSALWPSKTASNADLYPVPAELSVFGLQQVNFLPGLPGMYAGVLSPGWLAAFLGLLGALAGLGERWLLRACSPARVVMLAAAISAALRYEQGLQGMILALRSGIILALIAAAVSAARRLPAPVPVKSSS